MAGLPVLTCAGTAFAGRVAGSLLHSVGLPSLSPPASTNTKRWRSGSLPTSGSLAELRARLEKNGRSAPLFDTDRFRRHIESAYTTHVGQSSRVAESPGRFSVSAMPDERCASRSYGIQDHSALMFPP